MGIGLAQIDIADGPRRNQDPATLGTGKGEHPVLLGQCSTQLCLDLLGGLLDVHDDLVGHVSDTNLDLHAYNLVALTV